MRLSSRTLLLSFLIVILGTDFAYAQKSTAAVAPKGDQVVILSTAVDRVNQTLTIQGFGFGAQAPQVWCENYLMTVLSVTDTGWNPPLERYQGEWRQGPRHLPHGGRHGGARRCRTSRTARTCGSHRSDGSEGR